MHGGWKPTGAPRGTADHRGSAERPACMRTVPGRRDCSRPGAATGANGYVSGEVVAARRLCRRLHTRPRLACLSLLLSAPLTSRSLERRDFIPSPIVVPLTREQNDQYQASDAEIN